MSTAHKNVHEAIVACMAEVGAVGKTRQNVQQGYKFRGIADVYQAVQHVLAKNGVHVYVSKIVNETLEIRKTAKGGDAYHRTNTYEIVFAHGASGTSFSTMHLGEAMDSGDKSANKCVSMAMKYALVSTLCLPEDDPKIDTEGDEPEETVSAPKPPPPESETIKALRAELELADTADKVLAIEAALKAEAAKPAEQRRFRFRDTAERDVARKLIDAHKVARGAK